jgi:hypothetical protein
MQREPNAKPSVSVRVSVRASVSVCVRVCVSVSVRASECVGRRFGVLLSALAVPLTAIFLLTAPQRAAADPSPAAVTGFNAYIAQLESRLDGQHDSADGFLAPFDAARVRGGDVIIERLTPASGASFSGAMLHHWRGTAFVPGARAVDLERLLRDYGRYPQVYAPQVMAAKVPAHDGNHFQTILRVSQKHVITVVLDTTYDVQFYPAAASDASLGAHGYNISHSMRIAEIADPGTATEHALDSKQEHGFMWRLNTYWSWEERDGGLYMQIETVSLTRSVPAGLGWAIGPFINSIPRESLDFTMRATANALRRQPQGADQQFSERTKP